MPDLKSVLDSAYQLPDEQTSCSHFVWHVIQAFVKDQPYKVANELVGFLSKAKDTWEEIGRDESLRMARMATAGTLIVGGSVTSPHGHVVVVYPGSPKPSGGYAYPHQNKKTNQTEESMLPSHGTYARCISHSAGRWPGATSNGDKTIWDPWAGPTFDAVRFWFLKSTNR